MKGGIEAIKPGKRGRRQGAPRVLDAEQEKLNLVDYQPGQSLLHAISGDYYRPGIDQISVPIDQRFGTSPTTKHVDYSPSLVTSFSDAIGKIGDSGPGPNAPER